MKIIYSLAELQNGSRVGLYGSGQLGKVIRKLIEAERPDVEISCWVNSFSNEPQDGLDTIRPDEIGERLNRESDLVLISSTYMDEIVSTLEHHQVQNYADVHLQATAVGKIKNRELLEDKHCFESVMIELNTACDMKCDFCDNKVYQRPMKQMNYDLYRSIIDDIVEANVTDSVLFLGGGEPLLYKHLDEAMRYASGKGLGIRMYTNGLTLTPERYSSLLNDGLCELVFSFHNITEESFVYRKPNVKTTFQEYYDNLLELIRINITSGTGSKLFVLLSVSDKSWNSGKIWNFKHIQNEQKKMPQHVEKFFAPIYALYEEHGIEAISDLDELQRAVRETDPDYGSDVIKLAGNLTIQFIPIVAMAEWVMEDYRSEEKSKFDYVKNTRKGCSAMSLPTISHDGYLIPCCKLPNQQEGLQEFSMGHYGDGFSITDLFQDEKYQAFIDSFDHELIPYCQTCLGNYVEKE